MYIFALLVYHIAYYIYPVSYTHLNYASVANMTGEQFKELFNEDATKALSAFVGGLNDKMCIRDRTRCTHTRTVSP